MPRLNGTTRDVVARGPVPIEPQVEMLVRRACFATAAEALAEFRVHPDEIVHHLTHAGLAIASRPERVLQNLDGVAHAVACVRGDAQAWTDLANRHGWCLERAAMDRFSVEGGLAARRFWGEARRGTLGAPDDRVRDDGWPLPRLQWYAGLRPLRHWLADRLFGGIEARWESSQRERLDSLPEGRSLASPAVKAATAT
jgi:hypothetical protein